MLRRARLLVERLGRRAQFGCFSEERAPEAMESACARGRPRCSGTCAQSISPIEPETAGQNLDTRLPCWSMPPPAERRTSESTDRSQHRSLLGSKCPRRRASPQDNPSAIPVPILHTPRAGATLPPSIQSLGQVSSSPSSNRPRTAAHGAETSPGKGDAAKVLTAILNAVRCLGKQFPRWGTASFQLLALSMS